ncbi:germin-like protein subfamily 1 member 7 isoform X2 [Nicotiana tabacum]|uniref:Germin-like protein subfamily 1 member 7 isoform X2 n=1 Tax=Nicotiana tabacum TaxID=4097 RepID=A0AC58UUB2_TOBAC
MDFCLLTIILVTVGFIFPFGSSFDPSPFQDFCIAVSDSKSAVFVNGKLCKDPKLATADDFFLPGLNISGNPLPGMGSAVNVVDVNRLGGLNTLGISILRADFSPFGLIPPHTHPRGTEIIVVLEVRILGLLWLLVNSLDQIHLLLKMFFPKPSNWIRKWWNNFKDYSPRSNNGQSMYKSSCFHAGFEKGSHPRNNIKK